MLDALPGGHVVRTGSLVLVLAAAHGAFAQDDRPSLRAGSISGRIVVDGQLSGTAWESAEAIESFRQTDPVEGAAASAHTRVQVLADRHSIVIGVVCDEPDPARIVSFSVQRAVNPTGARYDGLINPGGEDVNADWDGICEAATARSATGWSAEIRIPILTLAFKPGLHEWHFNVQRRIQRRLETDRWASPNRQYQPPGGRPLRRVQPQRALDSRPVAARLEPAARQAAVRLQDVTSPRALDAKSSSAALQGCPRSLAGQRPALR